MGIAEYYDRTTHTEWTRLDRHPLEFELTKRHIDQYLRPGDTILDVGGGPGRYAFHYAGLGHEVSLVDLSPGNIAFARQKERELGLPLKRTLVANALDLPKLEAFDFVLCMGPLYHLVRREDRERVLAQCQGLMKPGARLVVSFITHTAQTISLLKRNTEQISAWRNSLESGMATGINDVDFDTGFTEAYFERPESIAAFVEGAGLRVLKVAGAEGLGCQSEERLLSLKPEDRNQWIDFFFEHSEDPSTLGANQHVICVAEKLPASER